MKIIFENDILRIWLLFKKTKVLQFFRNLKKISDKFGFKA